VIRPFELRYLPAAEHDLYDILDYVSQDDPSAARRLLDRLDQAIGNLAAFPKAGRRPADARLGRLGYRMPIVEDYLVFYVLVGRSVQIRRVIHGARRYEFLLKG
jgi:toxin ParE1/3/4